MSRTLSKFSLPFDEATTSVHFPKALERPRNNAGPASIQLFADPAEAVKVGAGAISKIKILE